MKPLIFIFASLAGSLVATLCHADITVTLRGQVTQQAQYSVPDGTRLNAVLPGRVNSDSWYRGAFFTREQERLKQTGQKAGLLDDFNHLCPGEPTLSQAKQPPRNFNDWCHRVKAHLAALPVTGRKVLESGDPDVLAINLKINPLLEEGDALWYPKEPDELWLIGAGSRWNQPLPYVGGQHLREYMDAIEYSSDWRDADWVWVISPDGKISRHGVAAWNEKPWTPAPGSVLWLPVKESYLDSVPGFNASVSRWLATQALDQWTNHPE
ncbi:capsule biosynthesis GfcC family protein [Pokkaliibacter sp. CJK22405]|uniref:capsule biosynthesis GfcC family protein n=1 Tax=Pokkaliibacter sp. CJK22405 TaxID=3384615 RepID=UPI003984FB6C